MSKVTQLSSPASVRVVNRLDDVDDTWMDRTQNYYVVFLSVSFEQVRVPCKTDDILL